MPPQRPALLFLTLLLPAGAAPAQDLPPLPPTVDQAHTTSASCSAFLPEDRPVCADRLEAYRAIVGGLVSRMDRAEGTTETCLIHCDIVQENWKLRTQTRAWSERAVRTMASGAYERRNAALASIEERRSRLRAERTEVEAELADLRKGRVVHLYEHTDTGAIVEHAGDRFEAQPPLRYAGERRAEHFDSGRRRIAEGEARLAEIDGQLGSVREQEAPLAVSPERAASADEMVRQMWGDVCTAAEADAWLGSCRNACHGGSADPSIRDCIR